jgi:hypothetical protein
MARSNTQMTCEQLTVSLRQIQPAPISRHPRRSSQRGKMKKISWPTCAHTHERRVRSRRPALSTLQMCGSAQLFRRVEWLNPSVLVSNSSCRSRSQPSGIKYKPGQPHPRLLLHKWVPMLVFQSSFFRVVFLCLIQRLAGLSQDPSNTFVK